MRIAVFFVFCLVLNIVIGQTSSSSPTRPTSAFNCDELTSHIQALKESTRSKKDKFSCILNLLKSALSDELENAQCQKEIIGMESFKNLEDKINVGNNQATPEMETEHENINGAEKLFEKSLAEKVTQEKIKDTNYSHNLVVPTMIPIFKQKPVMANNLRDNFNHARLRSVPVTPEAIRAKPDPKISNPKFTIPCQRAADVLDMSNVATPREVAENNNMETMQLNVKPTAPVTRSLIANQTPASVSVHCVDSDESVAVLFKPKGISLLQAYGNLLRKITITVLVPYHISKMGQQ